MKVSHLEEAFRLLWSRYANEHGLTFPIAEHKFHPNRRWRFDFAWPDSKIAIEIEGGTFIGGRHTRGIGYEADLEKYNVATSMGWQVYRLTSSMLQIDHERWFEIVGDSIRKSSTPYLKTT